LQRALVADGEAVQGDEARAHFEERHAPDLADGVHLVRRVRADGAAREGAVGEVDLRGVNVGEGERVVRAAVGAEGRPERVGEAADAVIVVGVVGGRRGDGERRVAAGAVEAVDILVGRGEDGAGVEVAPALAHAAALREVEARAVAVQAVREAVRQLVDENLLVESR
jgi:hypothetical protein